MKLNKITSMLLTFSKIFTNFLTIFFCSFANTFNSYSNEVNLRTCLVRWPSRGIHRVQVMKHASQGIHFGFQTQDRRHQKSKTVMSSKIWKKIETSNLFASLVSRFYNDSWRLSSFSCKFLFLNLLTSIRLLQKVAFAVVFSTGF